VEFVRPLTAPTQKLETAMDAKAMSAPVSTPKAETHEHGSLACEHVVQFYSSDEFLVNELVRLVGNSLASGQSSIVIATKEHREHLNSCLKQQGLNLDVAVEEDRYIPLDAAETLSTFMVENQPDKHRFTEVLDRILLRVNRSASRRDLRLTVFGEMVALLWADGKIDAAIRLEQLWNELAERHDFSLTCAYPTRFFDRPEHADPFLQVCAAHSTLIPDESYTGLRSEDERVRVIAALQQKARALDREVADHKRLQQHLADRVKQRTTELEQAQDQLRGLSRRLLQMQDEERRRIAFELHDSTGQLLAALAINVGLLERHKDSFASQYSNLISENSSLVQRLLTEVRALSYTLHPPTLEVMGVASALQWYVEQFAERCRIKVQLDIQKDLGRLPRKVEIAIFRIVQESLANVHRHAGCDTATVRVSRSSTEVFAEVSDCGTGITSEKQLSLSSGVGPGVGISGMRERTRELDGNFAIHSEGRGTTVRVSFPLNRR
jgi:signal transduction histidine kinase